MQHPAPYCIAFDIGGTTLRAGVVTPSGRLLGRPLRLATPNIWNRRGASIGRVQCELVELIAETVQQLQHRHPRLRLRRAGIAMAGSVAADGTMRHASGLWGDRGQHFPLQQRVQQRLRMRCLVVNDMTAAAAYYGSLPQFHRTRWIAVITVSSGVGGKVFDTARGEVLVDPDGISGELGHVRIDPSPTALRCECGVRGHVQGLCSGRAAERLAQQLAREQRARFRRSRLWTLAEGHASRITTHHLATASRRGDVLALDVLDRVTAPLAHAISVLVGTVGIEQVIIIGGFALGVGQPYLRALQRQLLRFGCFGRSDAAIRKLVCLGRRGDTHALRGVGRLIGGAA